MSLQPQLKQQQAGSKNNKREGGEGRGCTGRHYSEVRCSTLTQVSTHMCMWDSLN